MEHASFQATLAKVNFNGKKTVVTLELDNRSAERNIRFLIDNIDEEIIVNFGDPQMSMDLPDPEQHQGISGTIGANGLVESVNEPEGEQEELAFEDEDQSEKSHDMIDDDMDFGEDEEPQEKAAV